jgi:hypothetical protein
MGLFSWKCAVSRKKVASVYRGRESEQSKCYLVTPSKTFYEPGYEGYGMFGGADVFELVGEGDRDKGIDDYFSGKPAFDIKVVLASQYKGQRYDELQPSEDCERQGFY